MNLASLIDNLIIKINRLTSNFSDAYLDEAQKVLKKSGNNPIKAKKLLNNNNKIDKAKHLYLVDINKTSLQLVENLIDSYSKEYNIQKGRILFRRDLKNINDTFLLNIDKTLEQVVLDNMTAMQFTADREQVLKTVSNQINKSINQTRVLMEEALTTANRAISNKIFINIEEGLKKIDAVDTEVCYEYAGVRDSKNRPFCSKYIGKVMTRKQWLSIDSNIFVNMGGWNCRHNMELAKCPKKSKEVKNDNL